MKAFILSGMIFGSVLSRTLSMEPNQTNSAVHLEIALDHGMVSAKAAGPGATNFLLQTSTDLQVWSSLHQAYGHPGTNAIYFFPVQDPQPFGFCRALPGESLEAQKNRWLQAEPTEYRFRFRRMISFWEGGVRGTVRVRNGAVVEVTDAVDDKSGQVITQPDFERFFTISQIFDEMRRKFEAAYQQVQVTYDPTHLYPARVLMNYDIWMADDESAIEAGEFTLIEP